MFENEEEYQKYVKDYNDLCGSGADMEYIESKFPKFYDNVYFWTNRKVRIWYVNVNYAANNLNSIKAKIEDFKESVAGFHDDVKENVVATIFVPSNKTSSTTFFLKEYSHLIVNSVLNFAIPCPVLHEFFGETFTDIMDLGIKVVFDVDYVDHDQKHNIKTEIHQSY